MSDPKKPRDHVADLRGAGRLAIEATRGVTSLVEAMHVTIASGPAILGSPLAGPVKLATGLVYGTIRGVTGLVGAGIDAVLGQLAPLLGASVPGPEREIVVAILNGVLGDYLAAEGNPLAIELRVRRPEHVVPTGKIAVFVHGLCMADIQWRRGDHDHGTALARDLGYTPVHATYNSGLHISANGRALAAALEPVIATWPTPIDEIVVVGYSMGGLVARAACDLASPTGWRAKLTRLVTLGSPHHGAPLERGGNWIDLLLGVSRYSAPFGRLARLRSAGITDLRFGSVRDADWQGRDRFARGAERHRAPLALPDDVACHALAGAVGASGSDGMIPVASALGRHVDPALALAFEHTAIIPGVNHLDLLGEPVYATLREWLR